MQYKVFAYTVFHR